MGTPKFCGKYRSSCGQIWVPYHDSQSDPFWASISLSVGRMSEPGAVKGFDQPLTLKNPNTQLKKKTIRYG